MKCRATSVTRCKLLRVYSRLVTAHKKHVRDAPLGTAFPANKSRTAYEQTNVTQITVRRLLVASLLSCFNPALQET
jgi:hypothetical protein